MSGLNNMNILYLVIALLFLSVIMNFIQRVIIIELREDTYQLLCEHIMLKRLLENSETTERSIYE